MTAPAKITRALLLPKELEKLFTEAGARSPALLAQQVGEAVAAQASHDRQQTIGHAREAYREGFLTGRMTPRFVPFTMALWRAASVFQRLKASDLSDDRAAVSRYAKYEDL